MRVSIAIRMRRSARGFSCKVIPIGLARNAIHAKNKRMKGLDEVTSYNGYAGPIRSLFGGHCNGDD